MNGIFSAISAVKLILGLLDVEDDRFGEEVVAEIFRKPQRAGEEREVKEFAVNGWDLCLFVVQPGKAAKHPIGGMERVSEAQGVDPQSVFLHAGGRNCDLNFELTHLLLGGIFLCFKKTQSSPLFKLNIAAEQVFLLNLILRPASRRPKGSCLRASRNRLRGRGAGPIVFLVSDQVLTIQGQAV